MEPVSLAIGVPGLVKSCIEAYRAVSAMLTLDEDALQLNLQLRIEETRLRLWGRFWGILDQNFNLKQTKEDASNGIDIDEFLSLPGVENLVSEILSKIEKLLSKCRSFAQRYHQSDDTSVGRQGSHLLAVSQKVSRPLSSGKSRSPGARIRWALADKSSFNQALTSLVGLNDGLEKLLPRHGRLSLKHALVGELLSIKLDPLRQMSDRESTVVNTVAPGSASPTAGSDFFEQKPSNSGSKTCDLKDEAFLLPAEWFKQLSTASSGRTLEHFQPPEGFVPGQGVAVQQGESVTDLATAPQKRTEAVLVEWKELDRSVAKFLEHRTLDIAKLFHQHGSNAEEEEIYTLSCIGYVAGRSHGVSGLVFRLPEEHRESEPTIVSLADMLDADFRSGTARAPDLNLRLALARKLCNALYQVQCAGWVHRLLSSHNVIFFVHTGGPDASTGAKLARPYLAGWQSSRQDDQIVEQHSIGFSESDYGDGDILFVHPRRSTSRFRRSHDIYSLGIILVEIAFWEPIAAWRNSADGSVRPSVESLSRWSDKVYMTVSQELGAEVGTAYRDAVLWCLRGPEEARLKEALSSVTGSTSTELDKEIGIEKDFFWQVLRRMDATRSFV